jgi:hypothetical protein
VPASVNKAENGDPPGDQSFEEIEIAQEELIDAYVRGQLSADDRQLLEKGLRTSPQLVDRLHFARLLTEAADNATEDQVSMSGDEILPSRKSWFPFGLTSQRPALNLAFAACVLIIFIGGAGLLVGWIRLRRESQQLAEQQAALERQKSELQKSASEQQLATEQLRTELKEEQQKREADQQRIAELIEAQNQKLTGSSGTLATLFLLPSSRSSEVEKELKLPAGTSRIRLQLAVDSIDYRGFLVEVRNSQDKVISQSKAPPPRSGKLVTITILSKLLPPGSYSLQLSGTSPDGTSELVGNYNFRIAATQK